MGTFTFSSISITAIMLLQHCNNVTAKKNSNKKWPSLKSIGLGESDGGNVVRLKLICISSKVMGQVHKYLNIKIYFKKRHNF